MSRFHAEPTGIARLIALSALAVAPAVSWGIVQQLLGWSDGAIVWVPVSSFGLALWLTPRLSTSTRRALRSPQDRPA
jgi:hypothetical protein